MLYVSIFTCSMHPVVNWLYILHFRMGYVGAPLAVITTQWLMFLCLLAYTLVCQPHEPRTWPGFTKEAFGELRQYLRLAVPGGTASLSNTVCFTFEGYCAAQYRLHCIKKN